MDVTTHKTRRSGRPLDLTVREFELLEYLLRHKEEFVSREMLARDVWKETSRATTLDNVIDVFMNRLRHKVDENGSRVKPLEPLHLNNGIGCGGQI